MKIGLITTISVLALGLLTSCSEIIEGSIAASYATSAIKGVGSLGSQVWNAVDVRSTKSNAKRNNANINSLKLGQTKEEVVAIMGNADRRDALELEDGQMVDICFYRTEAGVATSNEFENLSISLSFGGEESPKEKYTPLIFKNDQLAGWGRSYYEQIRAKNRA